MNQNILLPIDGSISSLNAVQFVIKQWNVLQPSRLYLLNVQPGLPHPLSPGGTCSEEGTHHLHPGLKALAPASELLNHYGIPHEQHVLVGNTIEAIQEFTTNRNIEQIILGCSHKSALSRLLQGSTASTLMQQSPVPVLIIPDEIPLQPMQRPDHHVAIRPYLRHGMLIQMGVFEAVARLGSFTRAGEELFMAQSTVSVHVKKLTATIGTPLLDQVGKQIRLTPAGRELYAVCHNIFDQLGSLHTVITSMQAATERRLRLAVSDSGKYFVTELLGSFCRDHPDIEITLHAANRHNLQQRIRENKDDLYLVAQPLESESWASRSIGVNEMIVIGRTDHPLATRSFIPLVEVAQYPFLMREEGASIRQLADQEFARQNLKPRIRMEFNSDETIRQGVLQGLGLAILFRQAIGPGPDDSRLKELPVEGFPSRHAWHLMFPADRVLSPSVQAFVDYASQGAQRTGAINE